MNKLTTDRKYTIILSAYQSDHTSLQNLLVTEQLHYVLEHDMHVNPIRAIGVYNGEAEQSFVVHTNSCQVMGQIRKLGVETLNQECVVVSHNRRHEIKLHGEIVNTLIGSKFTHSRKAPKGVPSYTILNGVDYYTVS